MLTKGRLIQLVIMLVVLVFLFIWRTFDGQAQGQLKDAKQVAGKFQQTAVQEQQKLPEFSEELCQFKQPCLFKTIYGNFYLSVAEKEIKPEQWINLSLQSPLSDWQVKRAKIVGKSMYMGKIPVTFHSKSNQQQTAKTMVGACTEKEMIWRFDIVVEVEGQPLNLYYDFAITH